MTDEGIHNIKMMVIVALIYEITRSQPEENKIILKQHFHKAVQTKRDPPFTRAQRESFAKIDTMRVSNLTYFKCDEQSREKLLEYYELSEPIDQSYETNTADKHHRYEGTFPQRYREMLERIIKKEVKMNANTSTNSRSNYNSQEAEAVLTSEERLKFEVEQNYTPEKMTIWLLTVFQHVNFFNLLEPSPTSLQLENKDEISNLYWRLSAGQGGVESGGEGGQGGFGLGVKRYDITGRQVID